MRQETTTPKIVYKYRSWNDINHINFIASGEIYLASPADINDPFDCRIPNDLSLLDTEEKLTAFVDATIKRNYPDNQYSPSQIIAIRSQKVKDLGDNISEYQRKLENLFFDAGNKHFGIYSTSLIWDNIQMWSYYSDNHTGFCVGLDGEKLFDSLPSCMSAPINYTKEYPKIDPLENIIQAHFEATHTKDENWQHEQEYRYFSHLFMPGKENNSRIIKLPKDCFKEIIIGLQFPERDIEKMKIYATKLDVPIFAIVKSKMSFKLNRKEI
jgi:hypothetical protein